MRDAEAELAAFQAALLDVLDRGGSGPEMLAELKERAACAPFAEHVADWEPRCIEVASELVHRWGRTAEGAAADGDRGPG